MDQKKYPFQTTYLIIDNSCSLSDVAECSRILEHTHLQLMTARERDRSLRVGRWDLLAENRI